MRIKLLTFIFTISLLSLGTIVFAQTSLSPTDKQQISDNLYTLVQSINSGDTQKITSLISSNNPTDYEGSLPR